MTYFKIPVSDTQYSIKDANGDEFTSELMPISDRTFQLSERYTKTTNRRFELLYQATLPPMGFTTFFLNKKKQNEAPRRVAKVLSSSSGENFIENDKIRLDFSSQTGRVIRMIKKDTNTIVDLEQQFYWYEGSIGNRDSKQTSGAYIFRPNSKPKPVCEDNVAKIEVFKNGLVQEARQTFGSFVSQVVRLYKLADYAEFEYTVGPIPIEDKLGKEIITKFKTSIDNEDIFYTDANGREMKKRKRNFRETWKLDVKEPVTANYYPVNSRIFIKDSKVQFSVMTDRSLGGTSMRNGELELMLHRRLLRDDFLGVGEALNEPGVDGKGLVTRGKHRILFSTNEEAARLHRLHGVSMMMEPILR